MNRNENTSRMEFGADLLGSDEKEMYLHVSQSGHKRSIRDRSPQEVNTDEDIDTREENLSLPLSTRRGRVPDRAVRFINVPERCSKFKYRRFQFLTEADRDRRSGSGGRGAYRKLWGNWSDSKRMALIEEVSRRRNLWDNSSALYKDKQRADVEWHRIKETLNGAFNTTFEIDDLKKQWKNLRDSFQKRLKAVKEPRIGSGSWEPPTKWIFFDAMQFLLEFNDEEISQSNGDAYEDARAGPSTVYYSRSESRSESNSPVPTTFGIPEHAQKKTVLKKEANPSKTAVLSRICDELENLNQQTGDEFDVFGESMHSVFIATTMRKIASSDRRLAALAQVELTDHLNKKLWEVVTNMPS
ncbi:unnamed protein product [Heligmosomoides polygyrus]|uniref:MADF domain-containing protein n=1 Tax=Heligmosomoides polygyrus TaxID=6339 RepID=A0A183GWR8_HELPZ|nr:unnamed protein product [Heligmosomoides polygyrus]